MRGNVELVSGFKPMMASCCSRTSSKWKKTSGVCGQSPLSSDVACRINRTKNPVIITAPNGAEIRFTESLDMLSGGAPPIKRGEMIGKVEIRRPSSSPKTQPMLITTKNVGIDNSKIWTTETIHMKVGNANLVGRDLTLHLANNTSSVAGKGLATVLDRMELIYLDDLSVPMEEGSLLKNLQPLHNAAKSAAIEIKCAGSVEFDFAVDKLTLKESVALVHHVAGFQDDRFDCELLELWLRAPGDRTITRTSGLDWIDRITAHGVPARASLPSVESEIQAQRIDLDAIAGLLRADGQSGVYIRRGGIKAKLTQLAYQYDPNAPTVIGSIDSFGAGIVELSDPKLPVRLVQWKEKFQVQPQARTYSNASPFVSPTASRTGGQPIAGNLGLWIDGDVHAKFADGGGV